MLTTVLKIPSKAIDIKNWVLNSLLNLCRWWIDAWLFILSPSLPTSRPDINPISFKHKAAFSVNLLHHYLLSTILLQEAFRVSIHYSSSGGFLLTFWSNLLYKYLLFAILFQEASCVSPPSFKRRPFHKTFSSNRLHKYLLFAILLPTTRFRIFLHSNCGLFSLFAGRPSDYEAMILWLIASWLRRAPLRGASLLLFIKWPAALLCSGGCSHPSGDKRRV